MMLSRLSCRRVAIYPCKKKEDMISLSNRPSRLLSQNCHDFMIVKFSISKIFSSVLGSCLHRTELSLRLDTVYLGDCRYGVVV